MAGESFEAYKERRKAQVVSMRKAEKAMLEAINALMELKDHEFPDTYWSAKEAEVTSDTLRVFDIAIGFGVAVSDLNQTVRELKSIL